jgi:rod shape determining protein RodA
LLKEYQCNRIAVFLNPELDPRGAGYHITQSKTAFGSGGAFGEGYLQGPHSKLDFLPEKHTDFIFTVLGEEFGIIGGLVLLGLYMMVLLFGLLTAVRIRHLFGRLVAAGVCMTFFAYFAINMAMVMGLAPVVGVPLPLVSYGGTSMLVILFGFGLLLSAQVHGKVLFPRRGTVL